MKNKYIGIVLLIIGVALVAWGYNIYDSVGSQVSRAFSGGTSMKAWIGMVGGAVCIVTGILKIK